MSLQQALKFTLSEEGGYVNNPHDAGRETNHGIVGATYDSYRDSVKLPRQSVSLITDVEVQTIYSEMYWHPAKCPIMHSPLDVTHFDWAVNHGVSGALKTLQAALGVEADGVFGAETSSALALADAVELTKDYNTLRRAWYKNRVVQKPDQEVFLKGWLGRVDRLEAYCEGL
jgi:lysozyme family protein